MQNAETDSHWDEFTETCPIRDKEGKIYYWDCHKKFLSLSRLSKIRGWSKISESGNPYYSHVSGYSLNCRMGKKWGEFYYFDNLKKDNSNVNRCCKVIFSMEQISSFCSKVIAETL